MPEAVLALPILPDKEERWRRFAQDLLGDRLGECEELGRRLGVRSVKVYLARTSWREVILAYVEAEDPEGAFRRLLASEEPFDEWVKEKLADLHGFDLGRPRLEASPELIFEHRGKPRRARGESNMLKRLFYGGPKIEVLHEEYAKKGRIDEAAPVKASHEVHIEAPVRRVWELLSDVRGWGTWHPDIHDVGLDSEVMADARFTWANGKARMKSRFAIVEAFREISWTGISSGAKAVHRQVLKPTDGDCATRLFCEESISGPLLMLFFSSAKLQADMEKWLYALKSAAEASAKER
jgi:uncharacterized protein YndB with AHSA1/START domain